MSQVKDILTSRYSYSSFLYVFARIGRTRTVFWQLHIRNPLDGWSVSQSRVTDAAAGRADADGQSFSQSGARSRRGRAELRCRMRGLVAVAVALQHGSLASPPQ